MEGLWTGSACGMGFGPGSAAGTESRPLLSGVACGGWAGYACANLTEVAEAILAVEREGDGRS
jgi:hypothetical protein